MTDELPPGWAVARLEDVVMVNPPGSSTTAPDDQRVTFLPMQAVEALTGRFDASATKPFGDVKKGFTRFKDEDILFAKITPCMENGKIAVVRGLHNGIGCGSTEFHVLRAQQGIAPDYVRHFVSRSAFRKDAERNMRGAVGQKRVPPEYLRGAQIPIAPTAEQERIVSKIDELFSRIDDGERALERVSMLVERYRQSVLKAAVTGELTRAWRAAQGRASAAEGRKPEAAEKNKDTLESGEALLARILTARREAWEKAELEKMKAKGITPANDKWKQKYQEPSPPDTSGLPELPAGWDWATVGQLCFVDTGATPKRGTARYFEGGTIPWVTSSAVNSLRISAPSELITPAAIEETNAKVFPAGSFIVAMYGEGKTRGKISELGIDAATNQACAALVCGHLDSPVKSHLRSFFEKNYEVLRMQAAGGVQPNLNLSILKQTVLALPPIREIEEINERIAERQSQVAAVVEEFGSWGRRSAALRQATLRSAFCGELVGQDSADEPASTLLERIAAERVADTAAPKRGRKKTTAA